MEVLNKTVCIMLACTLWTGRRRLHAEDLGDLASGLPPEDVASMGSLKLCDPAALRELANIKRRAERACEAVAVKFLGGYATDEANLEQIAATLTELKKKFDSAAQRVVDGLGNMIDEWVRDHPEWEEAIRRCPPDVDRIAKRLQFDFQVFRIAPASDDAAVASEGLQRAVGGLTGQLYHEVAVLARTALKRSFEGKARVGQRAIRVIRVAADKLGALSYLDGSIRPVLDRVRAVRDALPKSGEIAGGDLVDVVGLLNLLGNEAQLARFGALKGVQTDSAIEPTPDARVNGATPPTPAAPREDAGERAPLYF